jgi:hypothetical protein
MEISNFELLIKRLAPGPASPLNRRVVQGYFLSITNLEDRDLNIVLRLTASSTGAGRPSIDRDLIPGLFGPPPGFPVGTNCGLIFDNAPVASNNKPVSLTDISATFNGADGVTNTRVFQTPVISAGAGTKAIPTIKSRQTVLIALLPNTALVATANLEIRGFVEIFQTYYGQSAKILVSAEYRGTFLDNDFGAATPMSSMSAAPMNEQDFDQIAYSVALAHGKGIIEI